MTDIKSRIAVLFLEKLDLEVPSTEIDLLETGIIDSLAFVELLLHIEQEFGFQISIDEFEMDHFRSIAKIAAFISRRCETVWAQARRQPAEPPSQAGERTVIHALRGHGSEQFRMSLNSQSRAPP